MLVTEMICVWARPLVFQNALSRQLLSDPSNTCNRDSNMMDKSEERILMPAVTINSTSLKLLVPSKPTSPPTSKNVTSTFPSLRVLKVLVIVANPSMP
jgi:hypothetical protein